VVSRCRGGPGFLVDDRIENLIALDAILSPLDAAAALRGLPAVSQSADAAEAAAELDRRVGRLRNALDALGGDPG